MTPPSVTGHRLGLLVGSSLADDALAAGAERRTVTTAHGPVQLLDTGAAVVVNRHHTTGAFVPAHRLDHRSTLAALAESGVDRVLALGSVGALRDWPVGTVAAPSDFYAPWVTPSYFDDARGHSVPGFDGEWRAEVIGTWRASTDTAVVDGGTYAQTRGPRFETPAEVRALARDADVVGMTLAAECVLAGEVGLAYAAVCIVDNVGNGLAGQPLTVEEFEAGVARNQARLVRDLAAVLPRLAATSAPARRTSF